MEGGERLLPIEALQVGQQVPALETVSNLDLIFFFQCVNLLEWVGFARERPAVC